LSKSTDIDSIPVLTRREIEARIVDPLITELSVRFGADAVEETIRSAISKIAEAHGCKLAETVGGNTLPDLARTLEQFEADGAIEKEVLELTENTYHMNITRCKYAEMYRTLGLEHLGELLSCSRDFALCRGFNDRITLTRTQTIMEGAECCDFRFTID
jgi:hypothetical protein